MLPLRTPLQSSIWISSFLSPISVTLFNTHYITHRSYFACSLSEPPFEPLRSRYSRSVLAAYAGACAILVRIRKFHEQEPATFKKMAFFGVHGFTAAIVLGSLAARAPDCPLAASALVEFGRWFLIDPKSLISAARGGHISCYFAIQLTFNGRLYRRLV